MTNNRSNNEKIPFLDLITPHQELELELVPVFQQVLRTAGFVGGPMVEEFEREFAKFCDAAYCVGVSSGTDAVRFALTAAGVQAGDVVLTVPHTFIATTEAITQASWILMSVLTTWTPQNCKNTSSGSATSTAKPGNRTTASGELR
jgi:dTDP-4-amino-4,6-dideoxygalactose transaminase